MVMEDLAIHQAILRDMGTPAKNSADVVDEERTPLASTRQAVAVSALAAELESAIAAHTNHLLTVYNNSPDQGNSNQRSSMNKGRFGDTRLGSPLFLTTEDDVERERFRRSLATQSPNPKPYPNPSS